ncbi:hypothetical protein XENORESO_006063, partial [Xenotaenia resolanae]
MEIAMWLFYSVEQNWKKDATRKLVIVDGTVVINTTLKTQQSGLERIHTVCPTCFCPHWGDWCLLEAVHA